MPTIRTGDWGATHDDMSDHCWVTPPFEGHLALWHTLCGSVMDRDEPILGPGNGETCVRCLAIVERAAKEVPQ